MRTNRYRVFIFPHADDRDTENGNHALRHAGSEEIVTFISISDALKEMNERQIDYGVFTEIIDLDTGNSVLETTDKGRTWRTLACAHKPAKSVPA